MIWRIILSALLRNLLFRYGMLYGFLLTFVNGNDTTLGIPSGTTSCGLACTELGKNKETKSAKEATGIGTFIVAPGVLVDNNPVNQKSRSLSNKKVVPASSKANPDWWDRMNDEQWVSRRECQGLKEKNQRPTTGDGNCRDSWSSWAFCRERLPRNCNFKRWTIVMLWGISFHYAKSFASLNQIAGWTPSWYSPVPELKGMLMEKHYWR